MDDAVGDVDVGFGQAIEGVSIIMIVYLTLSLTTAGLMNWYNKRRQLVER